MGQSSRECSQGTGHHGLRGQRRKEGARRRGGCLGLNLHVRAFGFGERTVSLTPMTNANRGRSMAVWHSATDDKFRAGVVSSWAGVWPVPLPPGPAGTRRVQPAITGRSVADNRPRSVPRWGLEAAAAVRECADSTDGGSSETDVLAAAYKPTARIALD